MKTLTEKLNESLNEIHIDVDEDIDSLTELILFLYKDYFPDYEEDNSFDIDIQHNIKIIKCQITFYDNITKFKSFKEAVVSTVEDFNKKMKSKGQEYIIVTWKNGKESVILELSQKVDD